MDKVQRDGQIYTDFAKQRPSPRSLARETTIGDWLFDRGAPDLADLLLADADLDPARVRYPGLTPVGPG
jgi:hypothetical protein